MITQGLSQAMWVFGKKDDLLIFGGSTLIALAIGLFVDGFGEYFWMYILHDQPHVYTTYFYTYGSDRFSKSFKAALIALPIVIFTLVMFVYHSYGHRALLMVLANYSLFHFIKQQTAWFFISGAKEGKKSNIENISDKLVIYSCVAGPALLSMIDHVGKSGWRYSWDLISLPAWSETPIYSIWFIALALYLTVQIIKYIKTGFVSWGKHFHLINGMLIWVIYRLEPFPKAAVFGLLLLVFGHSTPYLFLGQKYVSSRRGKGESFLALVHNPKFMLPVLILSTIALSYGEVEIRNLFSQNVIINSMLLTIVFTHFTLDSFIWRNDIHPEGLSFLKENSKKQSL
mgnify:CR=1 FL=1|tara:strand:+ start:14370 stop:15395 length:1026 start_codon:yes stop_codon:yes gene_type:complete